jgi:hypothetical protein
VSLFPRLLKAFYRSGLAYLPVTLSPEAGQRELALKGFLSRRLLDRLMTDLERAESRTDRIPDELLVTHPLPDDLLASLRRSGPAPVLNENGEQIAAWDEAELLRAVARFREAHGDRTPVDASQAGASSGATGKKAAAGGRGRAEEAGGSRWLGELILAALPSPMLALDLKGATLFYNDRFESSVLRKERLKNSIRLAETYFLELTRALLARSFEEDPQRKFHRALAAHVRELDLFVRVLNLEQDGRITGYLYVFSEPGEGGVNEELLARIAEGAGLETAIDELESVAIRAALEKHGFNVSHAAAYLKIKRSTLQNKIKRLKIEERFGARGKGPIRRNRRTHAERERGKSPGKTERKTDAKAAGKTERGVATAQKKSTVKRALQKKPLKKKRVRR